MCGEGDDRNRRRGRVVLQLASEREAILSRQLDVHQDQVGHALRDLVERLHRRTRNMDLEALELQHGAGKHLVRLVVLDQQDQVAHVVPFPFRWATMRRRSPTTSADPTDWRLRISETRPLSWRLSASVRLVAVRTMIGISRVEGSARSASTTSKPVTSGIIRSSSTRSGCSDFAMSMASRPPDAGSTVKPAGSSALMSQCRLAGSSSTMSTRTSPSPLGFLTLSRLRRAISSFASTGLTK